MKKKYISSRMEFIVLNDVSQVITTSPGEEVIGDDDPLNPNPDPQ